MATATLNRAPMLTLTDTPELNDLRYWWEIRQSDPETAIVYGDGAPQNFAELLARINTGQYLFYLAYHMESVVGAMWLHDIVREHDGTPYAGWLGTYVLPDHRGRHTTQAMWALTRKAVTALGARHIYIAVHHANTRAHAVAERHLGFHRVGRCPAFIRCGGVPTDVVILCMHKEDRAEAWALAHARASIQLIAHGSCILQSQSWSYNQVREDKRPYKPELLPVMPAVAHSV